TATRRTSNDDISPRRYRSLKRPLKPGFDSDRRPKIATKSLRDLHPSEEGTELVDQSRGALSRHHVRAQRRDQAPAAWSQRLRPPGHPTVIATFPSRAARPPPLITGDRQATRARRRAI